MKNLDSLCAKYGYDFATSTNETILTKALGVLQEQGLYAFLLFCRNNAKAIEDKTKALLKDEELKLINGNSDLLEEVRNKLLPNIDDLLLAVEVLEKSLIYARYHAKAMGK